MYKKSKRLSRDRRLVANIRINRRPNRILSSNFNTKFINKIKHPMNHYFGGKIYNPELEADINEVNKYLNKYGDFKLYTSCDINTADAYINHANIQTNVRLLNFDLDEEFIKVIKILLDTSKQDLEKAQDVVDNADEYKEHFYQRFGVTKDELNNKFSKNSEKIKNAESSYNFHMEYYLEQVESLPKIIKALTEYLNDTKDSNRLVESFEISPSGMDKILASTINSNIGNQFYSYISAFDSSIKLPKSVLSATMETELYPYLIDNKIVDENSSKMEIDIAESKYAEAKYIYKKIDGKLKGKGIDIDKLLDDNDREEILSEFFDQVKNTPKFRKLKFVNGSVDRLNDLLSNLICVIGTSMGWMMCLKIIVSIFQECTGLSTISAWTIGATFSLLGLLLKIVSNYLFRKGKLPFMW